ncbi:hypothetical protein E3P99_02034 [Wallemia hederae]|uniref:Uncharacterized protein n=1 Tax=Wallemia hederae TaxID=1540922 RepID=A0A4V4LTD2_9BASI|nr:hypothetical protein E3P99_02034 [Wallemia hederae]
MQIAELIGVFGAEKKRETLTHSIDVAVAFMRSYVLTLGKAGAKISSSAWYSHCWDGYQNIRNNYNKERTPKWAIRYKLVDVEKYKKRQQRNAWRDRYEGGIDSSGMFDARSSMSSDSSGKPFDVPFNTGSGPIDTGSGSGSSNLVSDLQAGMTRKRGKKAHKKDRWERSRISREELDPDYDTEEPEEPVGLYSSARTSREVRAEDNGNLAPDLRHEF